MLCCTVSCSDRAAPVQSTDLAPARVGDPSRLSTARRDAGDPAEDAGTCTCEVYVVNAGTACVCKRDLASEIKQLAPEATWATLTVPQGDRAVFGRYSREEDGGTAVLSVRAGVWGDQFGQINWLPDDPRVRVGEVSNEDGAICGGTPTGTGGLEPTAWLPDGGLWRMPNVNADCRTIGLETWAAGNIGNWLASGNAAPSRIPGSVAARIIGVESDYAVIADTRIVSNQTHFLGFTYSADAGVRELRGTGDSFGISPVAVARGGAIVGVSVINPQSHRPVLWRSPDAAPIALPIPSGASDVEAQYVSSDFSICGTSSRGAVFWLGTDRRPILAEELGLPAVRCVGAAPPGRFVVIDPTVTPVKTSLVGLTLTD